MDSSRLVVNDNHNHNHSHNIGEQLYDAESVTTVFHPHLNNNNNYSSSTSPLLEANDLEDVGVYLLHHHHPRLHKSSLPLSDCSPVNDDSGHGTTSGGSSSTAPRTTSYHHHQMLDNGTADQHHHHQQQHVGQSSDSNLYSLDDPDAMLLELESSGADSSGPDHHQHQRSRRHQSKRGSSNNKTSTTIESMDDEEIFDRHVEADEATLLRHRQSRPHSSDDDDDTNDDSEVEQMANALRQQLMLQQQLSETSSSKVSMKTIVKQSTSSSTRSGASVVHRRCQCVECQLSEHQLDNMMTTTTSTCLHQQQQQQQQQQQATSHHSSPSKHRSSSSSRSSGKRTQPPTSLPLEGHLSHHASTSRLPHHPVMTTSSQQGASLTSLERIATARGAGSKNQQDTASVYTADMTSTSLNAAIINPNPYHQPHVAASSDHNKPPLFYAVRRGDDDGAIFQPGLPPSLSVESLSSKTVSKNEKQQDHTSSRVKIKDQQKSPSSSAFFRIGGGGSKSTSHTPQTQAKMRHKHKKQQQRSGASKVKQAKRYSKKYGHHHHHHHHHQQLPAAPASSPTVASRHFGADTGGYPLSSKRRHDQTADNAADNGGATGDAAVLNSFGSFRLIIERVKRWFLQKSRKILAPRNLFLRQHVRSSSLSSLARSSSLSGASTSSSTTSLCDSRQSLTDLGVEVPPLPKSHHNHHNHHLTVGAVGNAGGSNSSLASSDSANSLLEFKRRVGKQRREMAEREKREQVRQQLQKQESSSRQDRHKQYLKVHGQNGAFTVTSTISCPTGRGGGAGRRGARPRSRGQQRLKQIFQENAAAETVTMSTNDFEHASLQLSSSWPLLVDKLSAKLQPLDLANPDGSGRFNFNSSNYNKNGDEAIDAFYNEGGDFAGPPLTANTMSTMAERRAGWRHYMTQQTQDSARDSVCSDCAIPFQDLEFADCVRDSDGHKIFSGRWYGTVMIHLFSGFSDRDVGAFWSEVHKMMALRHDNVALFMGAAVERSALAIVISVQTHISLFDQIHMSGNSMAPSVLTIGRQLAQGMGYLHSRNIVLGHLNSRNVFIDGKLKISMADCSKPRRDFVKHGSACLSRGVVTYLAPELLKSMTIVQQQQHINLPPKICFNQAPTTDTDVYAFGTLMYEVAYNEFPFAGHPLEVVIFQIANGCRPDFDAQPSPSEQASTNATSSLLASIRQLIEDCWCHDPLSRPFFKDIYRHIQDISPSNQALADQQSRRRCSSVPERLNALSQRAGGIAYY